MEAKRELSDFAKQLALKLFDDYGNNISTDILMNASELRPYYYKVDGTSLFNGPHWAFFFRIVEILTILVEVEGCDINQTDCKGSAPLMWAPSNRHEGVVEVLLGRDDVNPDKPDIYGRTPLWWAAKNGHMGVVGILLERDDIDPKKLDI